MYLNGWPFTSINRYGTRQTWIDNDFGTQLVRIDAIRVPVTKRYGTYTSKCRLEFSNKDKSWGLLSIKKDLITLIMRCYLTNIATGSFCSPFSRAL